jgi:phosphatidylglycerophosphate synthase
MFDEWLRTFKDRLFAPIARLLAGHISPDALSLLAFALGLGSAAAAWQHVEAWGLVLWILNRCCDGLDGTLARLTNAQSDWGGYLDILLDFTVYACIPIGFVLGATGADAPRLGLCALVLLGSFYVNAASWMYLAAILARRSGATSTTTVAMPPGLIGGAETIVLYALFFLLPMARPTLFAVMAALVGVTILQRLWWGATHLRP